jgi:hypothetical protein
MIYLKLSGIANKRNFFYHTLHKFTLKFLISNEFQKIKLNQNLSNTKFKHFIVHL